MKSIKTKTPHKKVKEQIRSRIFLVDDHPITREGVTTLINQQPHLIVCGEADSPHQALEVIPTAKADMAIIDVALKTTSGIELIKSIKSQCPKLPILVMSMHEETMYAERSLRAGARGYIMKEDANLKILEAINTVLRGELYLSAAIKEKMLHVLVKSSSSEVKFSLDSLSDRELEVYRLIGNGYSTRQIATKLCLSSKTIDSYRENLKVKFRLAKGSELVQQAIHWVKSENVT
jgi:DNA-binding NarL/FixJ family response regulator